MRKSVFSLCVIFVLCSLCCFQVKGSNASEPKTGRFIQLTDNAHNVEAVELLNKTGIQNSGNKGKEMKKKGKDETPLGRCTHYGPQPIEEPEEEIDEQRQQRAQEWLDAVVAGEIDDAFWPRPQWLRHISGIVASPAYADQDVYWVVQNVAVSLETEIETGGRYRHYETNTLHAITKSGRILARITLDKENYDWEDMGAYYDENDGKYKLVVFDTGEHVWQRNPGPRHPFCLDESIIPGSLRDLICGGRTDDIAPPPPRLFVIDEPNLDEALDQEEGLPPLDLGTITPTTHEVIYPDVNRTRCYGLYGEGDPLACNEEQIAQFYIHDTEAGLIDPTNGMAVLFGKQYPLGPSADEWEDARREGREVNNKSYVYTLPAPWNSDWVTELGKIDLQVAPDTSGGAGVRFDGNCVVIRTGHEAEEYCKVNPEDSIEEMFRSGAFLRTHIDLCDPNNCGSTMEPNGEAIGYTADGRGLITTSKHYRFRDPSDPELEHPNPPPPKIRIYECTQWE